MENNIETQIAVVENDISYSLLAKAEIDIQISTAKAFPRSLKIFKDKATSMATFSENVAASCGYAVPRSGKHIEGPSVRLAEIVCSAFGNIRAGARVVANDGKWITAQGICHDLESNSCTTIEVKRKITDKNGRTFSEDMQTVTGNAACAIAYRNAVFKVVPSALVEDIYDAAKQVAKGTAETLVSRRDKALQYFRSLKVGDKNITDKQICDILEIKKVEDIDLDKLFTLTGMRSSIRNGETTPEIMFAPAKTEGTSLEDLQMLYDFKKDLLATEEEKSDAKRILDNKETNSYAKLQKKLQAL